VLKAEVERLREQLRLRAAGVAERVTAELRAENERLREENERLRNQVEGLLSVEFENRRENERLREVWNVSDRIRAENERLRANQCDCLEGPRQAATGATGG
jgi:hypothetical protein